MSQLYESKGGMLMRKPLRRLHSAFLIPIFALLAAAPQAAHSQTCQASSELDDAVRTPIQVAGQRYFDMASKGDAASLKQNAIPSLASDFLGIETLVKDRQPDLNGAQATMKNLFLLDASTGGPDPTANAEFLCGVFNKNGQTSNSAVFVFNNLPPGKYAAVLLSAASSKAPLMFTEILQQVGTDWKLAGLYMKPAQIAGHDSDWFLQQARQYKAKGQMLNAWFHYQQATSLSSPVKFMSTLATDKLYDESEKLRPADLPGEKTVDLPAGTATYKLTAIFSDAVGSDFDLIVRYQSADASNTKQAYADNVAVMKALVAKYPELRDAFAGMVARAQDASGRDYGTLLAMKDIK
jgi:hypothetical protein